MSVSIPPRPAPAKVRARPAIQRRKASAPNPQNPPQAKVRGTYATRARREKAEELFRKYRRDRNERLRANPQNPGETREAWQRRTRIPNDETLRAIAESEAGIGLIRCDSAADVFVKCGVPVPK